MTKERKCCFKPRSGTKCDNKVYAENAQCHEHRTVKCWCGSSATHICIESEYCEVPLCDNNYCSSKHNIDNHIESYFKNMKR